MKARARAPAEEVLIKGLFAEGSEIHRDPRGLRRAPGSVSEDLQTDKATRRGQGGDRDMPTLSWARRAVP